jgi:hypothetical protein
MVDILSGRTVHDVIMINSLKECMVNCMEHFFLHFYLCLQIVSSIVLTP